VRTQLLCTFAHKTNLDIVIEYIKQNFEVPEKRIFVFSNYANRNELYCTFNAEDNGHRGKNTISIHRKKETNTLYTVNALNEVIKDLNNGVLDKTMIIPWEAFENSFILQDDPGYKRIDLTLYKRINF
jgi:hypothetical protein